MASPRVQVPSSGEGSTGNPILDSANALEDQDMNTPITLEGNRPAQSSPLKSSTITAADIDTAYPESTITAGGTSTSSSASKTGLQNDLSSGTTTQNAGQAGSVENVLTAIGGAVVTAPLAAFEAISSKFPEVVETVKAHAPQLPPHGNASGTSTTTSSTSTDNIAHKVQETGETLLHSAQNLINQASTYAQQGVHQVVEKLPESVTSHLPSTITKQQHGDLPKAATGEDAYDFTAAHTTGNFEASGSLQSTNNPALVEAQSDLAVKAESGDL